MRARHGITRTGAAVLVIGLSAFTVACSEMHNGGPTSPTTAAATNGEQTNHSLPGGAQVRSFDTATCNTVTSSFVSGTEVCAKATGLGSGFNGTLRWFPPGADVND